MNNMKNESQTKEKDLKKKTDQKSPKILKDQEKKKASEYKSFKVVEDLKIKLKEVEDKLLRELAENDNLRKRHEKEIIDCRKFSIKTFSLDILAVADNFQRAIHSIPKENLDKSAVLKNLVVGLESVEKEMHLIFERNGVKSFDSMGEKFDPELHQAVNYKNDDKTSGTIIEEMQKGYKISDRLLRPAMVTVSKGPEKKIENEVEKK